MQKKKNELGITLIATVVTIIIMLLLAGISVYTGLSSVAESKSQKEQAELDIIQQAVVGQYAKAAQLGFLLISPADEIKPNIWKGTMITQIDDIEVDSITSNIDWISDSFAYYEDYYYRLSSNDLMELGITNSNDIFVVNYKTGEVYNETKKVTDFDEPLYIKSIQDTAITEIEPVIDNTFSNDDIEEDTDEED